MSVLPGRMVPVQPWSPLPPPSPTAAAPAPFISTRSCCSSSPAASQVVLEEEEKLLVYSVSDARIVGGSNSFFFFFPSFASPCPSSSLPHLDFAVSALQIPASQFSRCRASRSGPPTPPCTPPRRPRTSFRAPLAARGRGCHAAGPADGLAAARRAMPEAAELGRRRGHHPQQRPQEAQLHLPDGAAPALHLGAR